jgi:hypothetical protein
MYGMARIKVNGDSLVARRERNVYEAIQQQRNWISVGEPTARKRPHYCYKEGITQMGVSATCRMCRVEREGGIKPVPSCARPVGAGRKVWTETPRVQKVREGVRERRLRNHPLDCPICDQGGECDLQEQTWEFGSDSSRIRESKRGVEDVLRGGPVKMVMTRCIHCTRCVRFGKHVAQRGRGMRGRGKSSEIGRYRPHGSRQTPRAGNRVDRCPVGARTSSQGKFEVRPWERKRVESMDVRDSVAVPRALTYVGGERQRVTPKRGVAGALLGDKTRYGYDGRLGPGSRDSWAPSSEEEVLPTHRAHREPAMYPVAEEGSGTPRRKSRFLWECLVNLCRCIRLPPVVVFQGFASRVWVWRRYRGMVLPSLFFSRAVPVAGDIQSREGCWVLGTALDRDRRWVVREEQRRGGLQVAARGVGQRGALRRHSGERAYPRPRAAQDAARRTVGLRRGYERPLVRLLLAGALCSVGSTSTATEGPVVSMGLTRSAMKGSMEWILGSPSAEVRMGAGRWTREDGGAWLQWKGKRTHGRESGGWVMGSREGSRGVIHHRPNTQGRRAFGLGTVTVAE